MSDELNDCQELNPDQDKEPVSPGPEGLPWERFQGLCWGLPATWWMIVRHPKRAFSSPAQATWMRAWGFGVISVYIQLFADRVVLSRFVLDEALTNANIDSLTGLSPQLISKGFVLESTISTPILIGVAAFVLTALPLKALLWIFSRQAIQLTDLIRLSFYSSMVWPLFLVPYPYFLVFKAAGTAYLYLGISCQFPRLKRASLYACGSVFFGQHPDCEILK